MNRAHRVPERGVDDRSILLLLGLRRQLGLQARLLPILHDTIAFGGARAISVLLKREDCRGDGKIR